MIARFAVVCIVAPAATAVTAQVPRTGPDSLDLVGAQAAAIARDPRARQAQLVEERARVRLAGIAAERRPGLTASAQAQYQSEVTRLPGGGPGVPRLPNDTYEAAVRADLALVDPTREARAAVARAQRAEEAAQLRATLHQVRLQVNQAFLDAAHLEARSATLAASLRDLDAQRVLAAVRVRNGAALPGDTSVLAAERLRRQQELLAVRADRRASLAVLGDLTGRTLPDDAVLVLPDASRLAERLREARSGMDTLMARPEFRAFAERRARLDRQATVADVARRPRVTAYARTGYGQPGLNQLATDFNGWWLGGVQLQWTPLDRGRAAQERELLAVERRVVDTEAAALREQLVRATRRDLATADRLAETVALDDAIIALRSAVVRETAVRLREGAATAAEYVDRETDLLAARLALDTHRLELAAARLAVLTTLGLEIRP